MRTIELTFYIADEKRNKFKEHIEFARKLDGG
jgi:hypothetical protein